MDTVLWILQAILAVKCLSSAFIHGLRQDKSSVQQAVQRMGSAARPLLALAALLMLAAALGLILPGVLRVFPWITPLAAAALAVMLLASIPLHIKSRDRPMVFVSAILFILSALVAYGRWVMAPL